MPGEERILAVGAGFTAEAIAALEARGAVVVRLGDFHGTDESHNSLPR